MASLPPITSEIFNDKVLQARAVQTAEAEKALFERSCEACQKSYSSENAYQNHLTSQKHKLKLASLDRQKGGVADDASSVMSSTFSLGDPISGDRSTDVDSDAEEEFTEVVRGLKKAKLDDTAQAQRPSPVKRPTNPEPVTLKEINSTDASSTDTPEPSKSELSWTVNSCIFCNYNSPSAPLNASHMERFHNMFIPEKKYLVDLEGLLQYLLERVHEGHQCLSCYKVKSTTFAVQTHMRDKGHCKVPFETEDEQLDIGEFYDFRSTYSDDESDEEKEEETTGGAKLGGRRKASYKNENGEEVEEGDGWETDSSASSLDSEDLTAVPAERHDHQYERLDKHPHHSSSSRGAHRQADGFHSHAHKHNHAVFYADEYELHLPSGKSVGHRSMARYYRQHLTHYPTPEERAERLALEGADSSDDTETERNGNRQLARNGNGDARNRRAIMRRDAAGMMGVSDVGKKEVKSAERRGRTAGIRHEKRNDYKYGIKENNQKTYYYRYQAGG